MLTVLPKVVGTLSAPDYALFVSHNHPDSQVRERKGAHEGTLKVPRPGTFRRFRFSPGRSAMGQIHDVGGHAFIDSQRFCLSGGVNGSILLCEKGFGKI